MLCQPKVKQRFSLHCRCILGGRQNLLVYVHIAMAAIFVYSLKDLGEKKKQPFMPQPLNGLESTWQLGKQKHSHPHRRCLQCGLANWRQNCFILERYNGIFSKINPVMGSDNI